MATASPAGTACARRRRPPVASTRQAAAAGSATAYPRVHASLPSTATKPSA
jgi:hypothetical protein